MSETISLSGLATMGGDSLRVTGDRTTMGVTSVDRIDTAPSSVGYSGDLDRPTMVPAITAETATEQHLLLNSKIADLDAKLNAQTFDTNTGKPTGYVAAEGSRERELLQIQRQSLDNALQYLAHRALEQLPKRGEKMDAADAAMVAAAQREQNIAVLASELDSNGREIGRVAAARLIDEAGLKDKAAALVRGGR